MTPEGRRALAALCELYWYPIYAFVRRRGAGPEDACDLTQGFFTRLLERNDIATVDPTRGRFRSWLLGCLKHYLANERDRAQAQKRGGRAGGADERFTVAEQRYATEPAHEITPERLYERRFALLLLERVLEELRADYSRNGNQRLFEVLAGRLVGDGTERPHKEVAAELGMTVAALKTATSRLYDRYERLLRAEVARIVERLEDVDDELRCLLASLSSSEDALAIRSGSHPATSLASPRTR